jgi:hypothetical protein
VAGSDAAGRKSPHNHAQTAGRRDLGVTPDTSLAPSPGWRPRNSGSGKVRAIPPIKTWIALPARASTSSDVVQEVLQHQLAMLGVQYLRVPLHAGQAPARRGCDQSPSLSVGLSPQPIKIADRDPTPSSRDQPARSQQSERADDRFSR